MIYIIRFIFLLIGFIYSCLFFIINPLCYVFEANTIAHFRIDKFLLNLVIFTTWIVMLFAVLRKNNSKYIRYVLIVSYFSMWLDIFLNHKYIDLFGIIILYHLLAFLPIYVYHKLRCK